MYVSDVGTGHCLTKNFLIWFSYFQKKKSYLCKKNEVMLIANPIYDSVFKRLMENKRSARFFIETLTGEKIEKLKQNHK